MSATDELRPCPMCGSTRIKVYTTDSITPFRRGVVRCLNCGFEQEGCFCGANLYESNMVSLEIAIDKWNGKIGGAK